MLLLAKVYQPVAAKTLVACFAWSCFRERAAISRLAMLKLRNGLLCG